jgi:RsiW-degrading membrane proteinase PrsW (M82 family)/DNA-directed RNA polymerase subunit RPC12/RpoP
LQFLIVVVLAFAPGVFWLWLVYRGDRYRPEPRSLVVRTFLWGMVVAIPVATLESFLIWLANPDTFFSGDDVPLSLATAAYMSFVVAGLTEELGKYVVVRRTVYRSPYFDEPMDGLVYSSAAALGFASLENFGYLLSFGWELILIRGPYSTLAHVLFAAMWGYPLGLSKIREGGTRRWVWFGLIGSMIAHGLFDFFLFTGDMYSLLSIPVFLGSVVLFIIMWRRARQLSPFKAMVGELLVACPQCSEQVPYYARFCTRCGQPLAIAKQNGPVFCGKCGTALNKEAAFCTSCGSRLLRKPFGS